MVTSGNETEVEVELRKLVSAQGPDSLPPSPSRRQRYASPTKYPINRWDMHLEQEVATNESWNASLEQSLELERPEIDSDALPSPIL